MNIMNSLKKMGSALLFALFLATHQAMQAKTIKIENKFNGPVTVLFPHFTTITGIERYPTLETIALEKDQSTTVSVKPYEYMGDLYIPNEAWIDDLRQDITLEEEVLAKRKEVHEKYSFGPSADKRFSIKVQAGRDVRYFVDINDNSLGQMIQKMSEKPTDRPSDGIRVIEGGSGALLSVNADVESKVYKAE